MGTFKVGQCWLTNLPDKTWVQIVYIGDDAMEVKMHIVDEYFKTYYADENGNLNLTNAANGRPFKLTMLLREAADHRPIAKKEAKEVKAVIGGGVSYEARDRRQKEIIAKNNKSVTRAYRLIKD